jgi:hypothetical protein
MRKKLDRVFLIRGSILIIIKIYHLNTGIITLKSLKAS